MRGNARINTHSHRRRQNALWAHSHARKYAHSHRRRSHSMRICEPNGRERRTNNVCECMHDACLLKSHANAMQMRAFASYAHIFMMASLNGNIFHVTCLLCGEFTGRRWIPLIKVSEAGLWRFLWSAPGINGWVNNHEAGDLRRHRAHYDVIVIS